ncbi:type IX secretion system plug protein [Emticicia soli]|uniref:Type IX secretion system plug protein domain-containing protein n=1 Tax=Emticicia soli TaxID=2027878 RepID=A0ABW5J8H6_9BACT
MKKLILIAFLLPVHWLAAQTKQLRFEDTTYDPNIRSVQLYPLVGNADDPAKSLNPPVVQLNDNNSLWLEFDDLNPTYQQYHVKILHCGMDWKQSVLSEIEYMPEYNDLIINDYQVSQNTKVPFYHYKIELPKVLLSGNYLVVVWKDRRRDDYMLSRRFMVYENGVSSMATVRQAQNPAKYKTHQQVDLQVNYGAYSVLSPRDEFKIIIRQNYRWDKIVKNLKPFSVNNSTNQLDFRFFDDENTFPGTNEFRFFDSRSTYTRGLFIDKIQRGKEDDMWVTMQRDRAKSVYIESNDFDGMYVIDNRDGTRAVTEADYIFMTFALKTDELTPNEKVYVNGSFNDWRLDKNNEMKYDTDFGGYTATIQLKQGVYNYDFVVVKDGKPDEAFYEGNFAETENTYEIFIYHKPVTARSEKLVSYKIVDFNKRR